MFNLFKSKQNNGVNLDTVKRDPVMPAQPAAPSVGILNLQKNEILNLTKAAPTLQKMRVAAGWDVVSKGRAYDLDLCAFLLDSNDRLVKTCNDCVYYGKKNSTGIFLDGDNLTGEGDGDDENIYVTLNDIPAEVCKIVFNVVIYDAHSRGQSFKNVKNAYVRLINETAGGIEVCRYSLTHDGGNNTAVRFAELYRIGSEWNFRAIGDFVQASISDLKKCY